MAPNTTQTTHDEEQALAASGADVPTSSLDPRAASGSRTLAAERGAIDLFVGISGLVDLAQLRAAMAAALGPWAQTLRLQVAYPGHTGEHGEDAPVCFEEDGANLQYTCYSLPTGESAATPWAVASAAERTLLGRAASAEAKAAVLLHPDLQLLTPASLEALAAPVLERRAELVVPVYQQGPYDGLLNHAILAPLTRALYGKRVRFPLPSDLGVSSRMVARLLQSGGGQAGVLLWPGTIAATIDAPVAEVPTQIDHGVQAEGLDLPTVLAHLVGPLFADMEANAPLWQRVRGSQPSAVSSVAALPPPAPISASTQKAPDVKALVDSFLLGSRSLVEVWSHVLPPVTLLELKRLTTLAPERFRVPDELWVRIVYDFALAYRLRVISRPHLLGALAPLYLGWVASWVNASGEAATAQPAARQEQLARAFEEGKPYLVRRWRWPDRFNP